MKSKLLPIILSTLTVVSFGQAVNCKPHPEGYNICSVVKGDVTIGPSSEYQTARSNKITTDSGWKSQEEYDAYRKFSDSLAGYTEPMAKNSSKFSAGNGNSLTQQNAVEAVKAAAPVQGATSTVVCYENACRIVGN